MHKKPRLVSIDGACVLKVDGQLNALMLPSEDSEAFTWTAWDGLPTARALDPQQARAGPPAGGGGNPT